MNIDWNTYYLFGIAIIATVVVIILVRAHQKEKIKLDTAMVALIALMAVTWIMPALDKEARKDVVHSMLLSADAYSAGVNEEECDYIWDGKDWKASMSDETRSRIECPTDLPESPCDAYRLGIANEKCKEKNRRRWK
jgi:hypothetical protein